MAIKITSATHNGLEGSLINIEVDISKGLPTFTIVGLADTSIKEAKERVRAAIVNSGYNFPLGKITVNLAPADVRKIGSLLDLPIAIGILMESGQIIKKDLDNFVVFGELSLSGELIGIKGALPIIFEAKDKGIDEYIFPFDNLKEIRYFSLGKLYPFKTLNEIISFIINKDLLPITIKREEKKKQNEEYSSIDYGDVIGQFTSKRAMEIAAAGKHNILLFGSPGSGKSMLAKALPTILPPLSNDEEIEIAKIYSVSGLNDNIDNINRPFRNPHHTITKSALVGGGKNIKAGEITLAHNGILFLDEILEFKKEVLELLREPLEEKVIHINRLSGSIKLPSNFMLVGAFNPCPCGAYIGDYINNSCICTDAERKRYSRRLSKALVDRIDLLNFVPKTRIEDLNKGRGDIDSKKMRENVLRARQKQEERFKGKIYNYNSEILSRDVEKLCILSIGGKELLRKYYNEFNLTMRGYYKIIKVARTIADLDGDIEVREEHIFEALTYRKNVDGEIV